MGGILPAQTYHKIYRDKVDAEYLRNKLKLKHLSEKNNFSKNFPHVEKFFREKGLYLGKIREHSEKIIGAGALTGALLLSIPQLKQLPPPNEIVEKFFGTQKAESKGKTSDTQKLLKDILSYILPDEPRALSQDEEKTLEVIFSNLLEIKAKATLEGEHLNTTYGYIGAEQHLRRYPGDNLRAHGDRAILGPGMAPGLGAWGYFAPSKDQLTPDLVETEKWYAVVQTLYLPDWNTRLPYLRDWYKYRKVLIVNPENGNAVVAGVADSGPAIWTGKHFGGSPEVMEYLGGARYKKGDVVLFFVDDPENKVPLGPVDYNQ